MPALVNPRDVSVHYFQPRKRSRLWQQQQKQKQQRSIDELPDECLFEILRHVSSSRDRSLSACFSKRWLSLLGSIRPSESPNPFPNHKPLLPDLNAVAVTETDSEEVTAGFLTRSLESEEATDIRITAIAIGTAGRGGLGKLTIRGSNRVTDLGLSAIACGCPLLEKLDLHLCPRVSDKGLIAIAKNCPNLTSLSVDSCSGIANGGLSTIGRLCPKLNSVTIKDCPLVGDQGIAGLMSSASSTVEKISLQGLKVSDLSLACIGHYGKAVTTLHLTGLENVAERGFWVMGNALGLRKLRSIVITACPGVTDLGLEAVAKGCPSLKQLRVSKCSCLSDHGLKAFAEKAPLEHLQLEECNRVSLVCVLSSLIICSERLKTLSLVNCLGIKDITCFPRAFPVCGSLRSLTVRDCPELTSSSLAVVAKICPNLAQLDLGGLVGVTDAGLILLAESCNAGLVKVNLKGCANLTDTGVSELVKVHGSTLKELNLDGCSKLTDKVLWAIADSCDKLKELDVSTAAITDYGIAGLASARYLDLQVLSLAGCSMLTTKILPLLGNMGPSLAGINLKNCNRVSAYGITSLEEKMYWCDILS